MCSTDVYIQNKPAAVAPKQKKNHPHFFVSGIGQKKTVDAAKICGGAENIKNGNPANIRKWICRFYYFEGIYTPLEAIVYYSPIIA